MVVVTEVVTGAKTSIAPSTAAWIAGLPRSKCE